MDCVIGKIPDGYEGVMCQGKLDNENQNNDDDDDKQSSESEDLNIIRLEGVDTVNRRLLDLERDPSDVSSTSTESDERRLNEDTNSPLECNKVTVDLSTSSEEEEEESKVLAGNKLIAAFYGSTSGELATATDTESLSGAVKD